MTTAPKCPDHPGQHVGSCVPCARETRPAPKGWREGLRIPRPSSTRNAPIRKPAKTDAERLAAIRAAADAEMPDRPDRLDGVRARADEEQSS